MTKAVAAATLALGWLAVCLVVGHHIKKERIEMKTRGWD